MRETGRTSYQASQSIEFLPTFESETNASFTAEIITASPSGSSFASTGNPFPSGATYKALTQTYYDNYDSTAKSYSTANNSKLTTSASFAETLPSSASLQTRGMVTSTKVWVMEDAGLTTGKWLETTSFYDDKARVVQTIADNEADGKDTLTSRYDFSGKVLVTYMSHQNPGGNIANLQVRTNNNYDAAGRITSIEKRINDNSATDKTVATIRYDEIGQLKTKVFGSALDSMEYDYNIRGWMLGGNRDYAKSTSSTAHYFGFDLGYDKRSLSSLGNYADSMFNGNIAGMVWKSTGDDEIRKYDFTYDAVNRLTGADFNQYTSSSFNKTANVDFSVRNLSYDANGNILFMDQKGWKIGGSVTIDSLAYGYNATSNKLNYVTDRANDTLTKLGDFKEKTNNTSQDYIYDGNGNMYIDNNKSIGNIHYNHLNLPDSITVTGKGTIQYVYDASGNKLKKTTTEGSKVTTTLYLFGNYVNDTLQYLPHEEGRVRYNTDSARFEYDYFVKDHLGNVRMMLTEQTRTDSYPACTMELVDSTVNYTYYSNVASTRFADSLISGYPTDNSYSNPNKYVAKTNGGGNKIGPAIILKVMAGDKFNYRVSSWYKKNGTTPGTPNSPLTDLVSALTNSVGTVVGSHATTTELSTTHALDPGILSFYGSHNSADSTTKPKAFVNWILFDEQFNYVSASSGFEQVGSDNTLTTHQQSNLPITKNGYLYLYVSNETPNIDVFFDNLSITHIRGPLLEESHYYPFGLTQQGISSEAVAFGQPENKKKYNGIELDKDLDVNTYEAQFRNLDPQTARWWQIDPVTDGYENLSPYASMYDDPVKISDPLGDEGDCCWTGIFGVLVDLMFPKEAPASKVDRAIENVTGQTLLTTGAAMNQTLSNETFGLYPSQTPFNSGDWGPDQTNASNLGSTLGNYTAVPLPVGGSGGGLNLDVNPNLSSGTTNISLSLKPSLKLIGSFKSDQLFATSNNTSSQGRSGKQQKLREIGNDQKASSADRGWIKQEQNAISNGKRKTIRVPPGKNLAHNRGKEARKGFSYKDSQLQDIDLHKRQHSIERRTN